MWLHFVQSCFHFALLKQNSSLCLRKRYHLSVERPYCVEKLGAAALFRANGEVKAERKKVNKWDNLLKSAKATGGRKVQKRGKRFECTIGAQCREGKGRENSTVVYTFSLSSLLWWPCIMYTSTEHKMAAQTWEKDRNKQRLVPTSSIKYLCSITSK